jgi:hypothetical protein
MQSHFIKAYETNVSCLLESLGLPDNKKNEIDRIMNV